MVLGRHEKRILNAKATDGTRASAVRMIAESWLASYAARTDLAAALARSKKQR